MEKKKSFACSVIESLIKNDLLTIDDCVQCLEILYKFIEDNTPNKEAR